MNIIIKNFINSLKHYKTASFLNITGLAVAFASFLVIIMQVSYEWSFDKVHSKANRIFRVDMPRTIDADPYAAVLTRGFADKLFESSPNIEAGTLLGIFPIETYITVGEDASRKGFKEIFITCYPEIVDIFDFSMVEGDGDLTAPEKILIPESLARRMFGNEPAVGKIVHSKEFIWTKTDVHTFTIGGVYKDFPENTQIENKIYTRMDKSFENDWSSMNFLGYVLLDRAASKQIVEDHINNSINYQQYGHSPDARMELQPLTDIYYMSGQLSDFVKSGNPMVTRLLFLIALLVIIIAGINFVNFSTALAPSRMKSINTQKVLGGSVASLRTTLIFEAVGMSLLAFFFALLLVFILDKMQFLSFIIADMNIFNHIPLVILLFLLALLVGFISGIYPSWYMTSFPPALVLKGSFGLSASGRKLRTALIGFQYVVSIGLIVGALFIQLQNKYMRSYDLGFNTDQIIIVDIGSQFYDESRSVYSQKLKEYPGIEDVAFSDRLLGASDVYGSHDLTYKSQEFYPYIIKVSWNFLDVMGIPVIDGRNFTESDSRDSLSHYIYNQRIQHRYNMVPGDLMDLSWRGKELISGFMDNIKLSSLRHGEDDVAFALRPGESLPISYIRLAKGTNVPAAVDHIRKSIAEIDPSYPFNVDFYDAVYSQLYNKEDSLNKMIASFSILAIILSIVGVFGLVVFETQYRKKEIGVRKVFGATISHILMMFNKIYFRIICICFILAAPIAFYFVSKWLEGFFYRTPIYWWIFALAFLLVTVITLSTVSFQNWRAATANPVDSIKTE